MSEDSTEDIKRMLIKQNEQMKYQATQIQHLIWQVVGNSAHDIVGLKQQLIKVSEDVNKLKIWREEMWKLDFKKLLNKEVINMATKVFIWAIGVGGGGFGVFALFKTIIYGH